MRKTAKQLLMIGLGGNLAALVLLTVGVTSATLPATAAAAEERCYADESGRIVRRRRPGFRRVDCPEEGTGFEIGSTDDPSTSPGANRTRPPASPIPRPDPSDYPAMVPLPDRWRIVDALA